MTHCPFLETSGDTGETTWFQELWITEGTCTLLAECSKTKFFTFDKIKVKAHARSPEVIGNRKENQKMMDVMLIFTEETRHATTVEPSTVSL